MRRRLNVLVAATTALVALAFVLPLGLLVRELAEDRARRPAELATRTLAPAVTLQDDPERLEALVEAAASGLDGPVGVVLPDGSTVGAPPPAGIEEQARARPQAGRYPVASGEVVVVPVVGAAGTGLVHALVPEAALHRGVATAWWILGGLGVVLVAGATALADVLARRTLTAVREVERLARRLAGGELEARAQVADPPEVARVADVLGDLAERVERLLEAEREAAADLSHRLRTPLTPLRIDVEALPASPQRERLQADVQSLEDEVSRVIRTFRSRSGAPTDDRCAPLDVLRERVAFWLPLAEDQDRELHVEVDGVSGARAGQGAVATGSGTGQGAAAASRSITGGSAPLVRLPADQLGEALDALLGNVFSHTAEGVDLTVSLHTEEAAVVLAVEDGGPGWPEGVDVGERGATGSARSTGLGLDIARRAAEAAGGELHLGRGAAGGASAALRLPTT